MKEHIEVLISEEKIRNRVAELADEISKEYEGKTITMVGILKGAVTFMVDLARKIDVPVEFDFMDISSYGDSTESSGLVRILKDLDAPVCGKDVLLVEDIIDTGNTLGHLIEHFKAQNPNSVKICTLLDKPERRLEKNVAVDYTGFVIKNEFVVGYGLDYSQKYRNLPYIGVISFEE